MRQAGPQDDDGSGVAADLRRGRRARGRGWPTKGLAAPRRWAAGGGAGGAATMGGRRLVRAPPVSEGARAVGRGH